MIPLSSVPSGCHFDDKMTGKSNVLGVGKPGMGPSAIQVVSFLSHFALLLFCPFVNPIPTLGLFGSKTIICRILGYVGEIAIPRALVLGVTPPFECTPLSLHPVIRAMVPYYPGPYFLLRVIHIGAAWPRPLVHGSPAT